MRHLIDPLDFSKEEVEQLLDLADRIIADPTAYQEVCAHKKAGDPLLRGLPPAPSPLKPQC